MVSRSYFAIFNSLKNAKIPKCRAWVTARYYHSHSWKKLERQVGMSREMSDNWWKCTAVIDVQAEPAWTRRYVVLLFTTSMRFFVKRETRKAIAFPSLLPQWNVSSSRRWLGRQLADTPPKCSRYWFTLIAFLESSQCSSSAPRLRISLPLQCKQCVKFLSAQTRDVYSARLTGRSKLPVYVKV